MTDGPTLVPTPEPVKEDGPGWIGKGREYLPTLVVLATIILFWEFFNDITGEPEWVLPPLHKIINTAFTQAGDRFLPAAWITLQEMLLGFGFGAGSGLGVGILIFQSQTFRRALMPFVISTQAIPVIAIAPLLILWFGFGMTPKVIVAALISFFPVVVNTISGLSSVERDSVNLMRSFGANEWKIFAMVRFPASLPYVFTGLKNAAAISAIGAIVGEWVGAHEGLGPVMIAANAGFKTDIVFAAIFYLATMAISMFLIVSVIERIVLPWHYITRDTKTKG
jgi:ABC-type nitrate/sulfonate/bicarbonate transport system permease component